MKIKYDENYYEKGVQLGISGYSNYRWLEKLTVPMCETIVTHLKLASGSKILDFGCAKGFLVKALRMLDMKAWGVDVSEYAINHADKMIKDHVFLIKEAKDIITHMNESRTNDDFRLDCVIAKDVFEHLSENTLHKTLLELRKIADCLFIVVPLGENGKYVVPEYEQDATHVIREDAGWWVEQITKAGFSDLTVSYRVPGIKDNWAHYETGNLFVTAK